ncbi:hypothetical protein SAMN04488067_11553 [Halorubrum xinjiangense]|uniref:Uncharacterized protein n=1 Tax=Halorubrum xinjiangense TaxID=261291 RepID=A0A1G7RHI7_9EURY|nr:hypothetical protein SAMN04488067_11553 [Halorubrum xinjiangense]
MLEAKDSAAARGDESRDSPERNGANATRGEDYWPEGPRRRAAPEAGRGGRTSRRGRRARRPRKRVAPERAAAVITCTYPISAIKAFRNTRPIADRRRNPPNTQPLAYKWLTVDRRRTPPKPQPLTYKWLTVDRRRTPPKPQPRGRRTLAALLARSARCGAYVACGGLAAAPLSPARTATAPHASPASPLAPFGRSRRPSRVLLAAAEGGRSQARATAPVFIRNRRYDVRI